MSKITTVKGRPAKEIAEGATASAWSVNCQIP